MATLSRNPEIVTIVEHEAIRRPPVESAKVPYPDTTPSPKRIHESANGGVGRSRFGSSVMTRMTLSSATAATTRANALFPDFSANWVRDKAWGPANGAWDSKVFSFAFPVFRDNY